MTVEVLTLSLGASLVPVMEKLIAVLCAGAVPSVTWIAPNASLTV